MQIVATVSAFMRIYMQIFRKKQKKEDSDGRIIRCRSARKAASKPAFGLGTASLAEECSRRTELFDPAGQHSFFTSFNLFQLHGPSQNFGLNSADYSQLTHAGQMQILQIIRDVIAVKQFQIR